jgi:hypothetical protein
MLPLPWIEVRCQGNNAQPTLHYRQTGAQMLVGQCTRLDPGATTAAGTSASATSMPRERPLRFFLIWLWLLTVVTALSTGLAARSFVPALVSLILSCLSLSLLVALLIVVTVEEVFNSVQLTPWPAVAFLACLVGAGGSIATLVLCARAPRRRDPDEDG